MLNVLLGMVSSRRKFLSIVVLRDSSKVVPNYCCQCSMIGSKPINKMEN
jgi:hypothetical protein